MFDPYNPVGRDLNDSTLGVAFLLSAGLHVLLAGLWLFILPHLTASRKINLDDVITVQLLGSLSPPAPAAPPAPVDPNLKGPDVVEAPKSDPALNQPAPPQPAALTAPAEVIPLGPKAPEKPPVIKRTPVAPPQVTPPKVAAEPPPKPKTPPNNDAEINRKMAELRRKTEAAQLDANINSHIYNIQIRQGLGQGDSSEEGGGASNGRRVHPEIEAYSRRIKDIIESNWLIPPGSAGLKAVFSLRVEPGGRVSARLDQSSGNSAYDLSVERAIGKSILPPLPPIFEGRTTTFALGFTPR